MAFTIHFFGLISHVSRNRDSKDLAVIIRDIEHNAGIRVGDTFDALPENTVIEFDNLARGPAFPEPGFRDYVPHLADVTDGHVRDDVMNGRTSAPEVHAYVRLPRGQLSVSDFFEKIGTYRLNGNVRHNDCVARVTTLSCTPVDPRQAVVIRTADGEVLARLDADDSVTFFNYAKGRAHHGQIHRHFKKHKNITDARNIADVEEQSTSCPRARKRLIEVATQIECSNSQYP